MSDDEIRDTWEELSTDEAFEAFDCEGSEPDVVERVLGKIAAIDYGNWIYTNLK